MSEEPAPLPSPEPTGEPETLVEVPEEVRQLIGLAVKTESWQGDPRFLPLRHVNAEHLTALQAEDGRENARRHTRWLVSQAYRFGALLLFAALALFLVFFLGKSQPQLLTEILKLLATFAGGMGIGYGLGQRRKHQEEEEND